MDEPVPPRAVIFDLGGTLIEWPDEDPKPRWTLSYRNLTAALPQTDWPPEDVYVQAMVEAELAHWRRVVDERWSGPPSGLVRQGFRHLGLQAGEREILGVLDAYARAVDGWSIVCHDAPATLRVLKERGYRLGLLSNTWWAAEWHNAELATHGLASFLDEVVYTSDMAHSKPDPFVFREVASRLDVDPAACVMVGDRLIDDIAGGLGAGMRAVWKRTNKPWPRPEHIVPTGTVDQLAELPPLLQEWGGA